MEEYELDGRRLRVAFANKPSGRGENGASSRNEGKSRVSKSLFIANIPPEVKIGEMEEYFGRYGKGTWLVLGFIASKC
jgi:RNA recognition motif-containing protein